MRVLIGLLCLFLPTVVFAGNCEGLGTQVKIVSCKNQELFDYVTNSGAPYYQDILMGLLHARLAVAGQADRGEISMSEAASQYEQLEIQATAEESVRLGTKQQTQPQDQTQQLIKECKRRVWFGSDGGSAPGQKERENQQYMECDLMYTNPAAYAQIVQAREANKARDVNCERTITGGLRCKEVSDGW